MEGEKALCPSKTEDGDQCGNELTFSFKWCPECGARVDRALFQKKEAEIMVPDTHTDVYTRHIPNPTISSTKTESGNPVTQNEVYQPNSGEETKDTKENEDAKDNISEGRENDIVDVLEERQLEDIGSNEDIIPNVKEDKDKEVYAEKELLTEEEGRKLDKRKERDKGLFRNEEGTGNSEESYDDRQIDAVDTKRNEEKDIFEPGTYQQNERKESDRVEEIEHEEKIGFDIKSDGPDNDEDKEIEIKERRMDANQDKENWKVKEAFDKVGYRAERVGPESFHTLEMLRDQKEGEKLGGENLNDNKNDDDVNEIIEDRKEGPLAENDEDGVNVSYEKGRGDISIYKRLQGEKDGKRKVEEGGDLERMDERIEKKRKVDRKRIEENKGNETNSNEESESQREGDNGNEKKEEKEGDSEEKGEEEADFDPPLRPSDENTSFCSNLAESNRSSFKGYNDQHIEQNTVTTDNTAQHEEGIGNGREVNASNVKILVDKGVERKITEEEEEEEEEEKEEKDKQVKKKRAVDNNGSSDGKQENAVNGNENKEKKEEEIEKVEEEESLNRIAVSGSKREESRNENEQGADQGDKKEEITGVEKERMGEEREAYCGEIEHNEKSSRPDKKNDEFKENKIEKDGRKNENEDEKMQPENEEKKLDKNIKEEGTVTDTNSKIEEGKDTKGGADIIGGIEKKAGVPSGGSFKEKGKGEEQKNGDTEKDKEQLKMQNAQPLNSNAQQTDSCRDDQPKQTMPVYFHAFLSSSVNFDKKKDSLYVVFGPERDDWECKPEGLMKYHDSNRKGKEGIRMFAKVELERALLSQGLFYCYRILRKSSENTSTGKEIFLQPFYPYDGYTKLNISPDLDSYQRFDGYIYVKTGGKIENFLTSIGLMKSNMHKTMKNDGKRALKEYLPNIYGVMRTTNQAPLRIVETVNEYCQVFQGGVKDQFLQDNNHLAPDIWQECIMKDHLKQAIEVLGIQQNKMDENGKLLKSLMMIKLLVDLNFSWKFLDNRTVEIIQHSLLLSPDTNRNQCPQLEFLQSCLAPPLKRDINRSLQLFLKGSARKTEIENDRNPSWIMCLPIVHYLEGSLNPFAELDFTNFHDKQNVWWIDCEFEKEKDELKSRKWSRSAVDLMNVMRPLFKLDTKTQRCFMACLKWEDLEMAMREENILLEIKLATLQHYFQIANYSLEMESLLHCIKTVNEILERQLNQLSNASERDWNTVKKRFFIQQDKCAAILSIGTEKCDLLRDRGKLASLYHCNMLSLAAIDALCFDSDEVKSLRKRSTYLINDILSEMKQEITVYDFALSILNCVRKNELTALWEKQCIRHAKQMICKFDTKRLLELYDAMTNLQNEALKNMIEDAVMNSIADILQSSQVKHFIESNWTKSNNFLVSKMFSQMWNIDLKSSNDTILSRALSSSIYPKCVESCLLTTNIFKMMDHTAQENLDRSVMILRTLCWSLYENTVIVETLEFIISKKEVFLAVVNVFENCGNENVPLITSEFENLLLCRDKDLKSLEEVVRTVEKLQFLLKEISERSNISITEIDEDSLQNWRFLEIKAVCSFPEESVGRSQYQPEVILFKELLLSLGDFVKDIYYYHESKSFHKILTMLAETYRNTPDMKFDDIVKQILIPTKQIWDDLCTKMKNGSISVRELEKNCFVNFQMTNYMGNL